VDDCVANRTQQLASHATSAVAADHNQLGRFRLFDQLPTRVIENDESAHLHIRIAFLPARQIFGQTPLGFRHPIQPRAARKVLGSTAESVAQNAHCPVAVIRSNRDAGDSPSGWVAVVVDDSPTNDAVLEYGFTEAQLRKASILAMGVWRWGLGEIPYRQLDYRLGHWAAKYPDVHVRPAAVRDGSADYLSGTTESVQLAVVGSSDADNIARMVSPITPHFGHAGCSVLVVRTDEYQSDLN
jgi:hypothetical protein